MDELGFVSRKHLGIQFEINKDNADTFGDERTFRDLAQTSHGTRRHANAHHTNKLPSGDLSETLADQSDILEALNIAIIRTFGVVKGELPIGVLNSALDKFEDRCQQLVCENLSDPR